MEHKVRTPEHKFRVDQEVDFFQFNSINRQRRNQYTIIRLLPLDGNTPQYRIKNKADGQERMVRENELGSRKLNESGLPKLFADQGKKIS